MVSDHVRIDGMLAKAMGTEPIDPLTYARFRHDLLRHIAMEERVLLPFARVKRLGSPLPFATELRADHAEIAKILVRSPSSEAVEALLTILGRHNPLEEGPDGLYAACDRLADADEAAEVVERLKRQGDLPLALYNDRPHHRSA